MARVCLAFSLSAFFASRAVAAAAGRLGLRGTQDVLDDASALGAGAFDAGALDALDAGALDAGALAVGALDVGALDAGAPESREMFSLAASAPAAGPRRVFAGVTYEAIGTLSAADLNHILRVEAPAFTQAHVSYAPATNGVRLFRVVYGSVIPERGNRRTRASGLVAIPDAGAAAQPLPLLSYQHGTVVDSKYNVPSSFVANTSSAAALVTGETRLVVAQFAGQGYVVAAADYFGLGLSQEPDGYAVLGSHNQACFDMLEAALGVADAEGVVVRPDGKFVAGWSQGGKVTMALLEHLHRNKYAVRAAATAAAQCDAFAMLNGYLSFPRGAANSSTRDAPWVAALFILTAFSYENYYGLPGLSQSLIVPHMYDVARSVYTKPPINGSWAVDDLHELIRPEFFDPVFFADSQYGRIMQQLFTYRWLMETPVKMFYGGADESLTTGIATMPARYQQSMGTGNTRVTAHLVGKKANHRQTFGIALKKWKKYFDSVLADDPHS